MRLRGKDRFVGCGGSRPCNPGETGAEDRWRYSHRRLRIPFRSHVAENVRLDPAGGRVSDRTWVGCCQLGVRVPAPAAMLCCTNMVSHFQRTRGSLSRAAPEGECGEGAFSRAAGSSSDAGCAAERVEPRSGSTPGVTRTARGLNLSRCERVNLSNFPSKVTIYGGLRGSATTGYGRIAQRTRKFHTLCAGQSLPPGACPGGRW